MVRHKGYCMNGGDDIVVASLDHYKGCIEIAALNIETGITTKHKHNIPSVDTFPDQEY